MPTRKLTITINAIATYENEDELDNVLENAGYIDELKTGYDDNEWHTNIQVQNVRITKGKKEGL